MPLTCANCGRESPDDYAFCPACAAPLSGAVPGHEVRKTVTVVFCDVSGSTALGEKLDPEALRDVQSRYFAAMRGSIERHGGTVEKYIGDAVMAVFGIPRLHEDDALRAARAVSDMREALAKLNEQLERDRGVTIQVRIGVNTGEVVAGDPAAGQALVTGDAVNVAARLEQRAVPGEVLIGRSTLPLIRDAADVEPIEPLELRGKGEPVPAYRLLRVHDAPERRYGGLFVGREREFSILLEAYERVRTEQRCELVTVAGDAGVGKSRLATEVLATIEGRVLRGRCLPYGEGITYWPVVEVLKQLDVLPPEEAASEAIRSLIGETEAVTSAEEIAWAFRKTLEQAAAGRPLVVVFDDIQWGEETFLDLIEHIALLSSGASILLLCMARPELSERRPSWVVTLRLEPLGDEHVDELIPKRFPVMLRQRIARAAGGNPLFVEEMLAIAGDAESDVSVPPTLQALLAARLDQLETAERSVLEWGAIEGEIFHRGAVQALAAEGTQVTPRLAALVRKELIRPEAPQLAGEDGFRFRHLLIRDAAYDALPKATRADLRERFASWLEKHGAEIVELDELVGFHLERACRYHAELGTPDDGVLAAAARRRLTAGGHRAALRQDFGAAVSLFERAVSLVPSAEFDLALETGLGDSLFWAGRGDDARRRADALAERAAAVGDRVGELCGRVQGGRFHINLETGAAEKLSALVDQALPVFEAAGDDLALYIAYYALAEVAEARAQMGAGLEAVERAFAHARQAGYAPPGFFAWLAACRYFGTTPVSELLAWLDENEPRAGRDHFLHAFRAGALAMLGRFDEARAILADARAELGERGGGVLLANMTAFESVDVERWAGDPAAAAEFAAEGFRLHEELGDKGFMAAAAGDLAQALYALDRLDEADAWANRPAELGGSDDAMKEMIRRQVRAKVLARRGEHADAERLAREAVAIGEGTDFLNGQGDASADLAEVLLLGGRADEAAEALEQAFARYERKGNVVMAAKTRSRLDASR